MLPPMGPAIATGGGHGNCRAHGRGRGPCLVAAASKGSCIGPVHPPCDLRMGGRGRRGSLGPGLCARPHASRMRQRGCLQGSRGAGGLVADGGGGSGSALGREEWAALLPGDAAGRAQARANLRPCGPLRKVGDGGSREWLGAVRVLGNFGPVEELPLGRAGAAHPCDLQMGVVAMRQVWAGASCPAPAPRRWQRVCLQKFPRSRRIGCRRGRWDWQWPCQGGRAGPLPGGTAGRAQARAITRRPAAKGSGWRLAGKGWERRRGLAPLAPWRSSRWGPRLPPAARCRPRAALRPRTVGAGRSCRWRSGGHLVPVVLADVLPRRGGSERKGWACCRRWGPRLPRAVAMVTCQGVGAGRGAGFGCCRI